MRERLHFLKGGYSKHRITPAYAGKTIAKTFPFFPYQDHPRVCGKDLRKRMKSSRRAGSPPRMRERLNDANPTSSDARITPAYAGKTTGSLRRHSDC